MGFFTDTTVCIGCKACEVACKQWNDLPADGATFRRGGSYDHTGSLGAATLAPRALRRAARAVADAARGGGGRAGPRRGRRDPAHPGRRARPTPAAASPRRRCPTSWRWPVSGGGTATSTSPRPSPTWTAGSSCPTSASTARTPGCMDACPTGALIRTEFETVVAAARRLQRLRLLHPVVPVRRRRPRPHRRPRRQVHALLRPPPGRPGARVREGVPDRLDPVRPLRRARRRSPSGASSTLQDRGLRRRLPLRRGRRPRRAARRRPRRVLPADRAARALRAARAGRLADPGERRARHRRGHGGRPGRGRGGRRRVRGAP